MKFIREHYERFDDGARREADRIMDNVILIGTANARERIASIPDGAEKRQLARLVARSERAHVTAQDLMAVLEGKTSQKAEVVADCVEPFACALQACADLLFDARSVKASGKRDVVLHGLFIGLLDEVLVAFHLAQRAFVAQAYAHLRTVEEVLDAVDVLANDPGLLDEWLDATGPEDERRVFSRIRRRVGTGLATAESRTLYAFLSALGPHSQFRSVQSRTVLSQDDAGERVATFSFLGSPMHIDAANLLTVRSAVAMAHHISRLFASSLNEDDVDKQLERSRAGLAGLVRVYLLPVAEQMDLTPDEVQRVLFHRIASASP